MLSLTRKSDYALVAMAYLTAQKEITDEPVSARQIARAFDLPQPLLMNILKALAGGGMLESTRGIHGGYRLARNPRNITMLDVVQVIEGSVPLTPCTDAHHGQVTDEHATCCAQATCPIRRGIHRLHARLNSLLATMTVQDLIETDPVHQHNGQQSGHNCCHPNDQANNKPTANQSTRTIALTQSNL